MTPNSKARSDIDKLLSKAGWLIQDAAHAHISAGPGVAIREFPLPGHGFADYLLYVNGLAAGIIEARRPTGATLSGVEIQSAKYSQGLPAAFAGLAAAVTVSPTSPPATRPVLPTAWIPEPRARPCVRCLPSTREMLAEWLSRHHVCRPNSPVGEGWGEGKPRAAEAPATYTAGGGTFLARLQTCPLIEEGLWPPRSPPSPTWKSRCARTVRALIQMATGSRARPHLHQLHLPADQVRRCPSGPVPGGIAAIWVIRRSRNSSNTSAFTTISSSAEYIVQRLSSNTLDTTARVCICTIQRMYSAAQRERAARGSR